VHTVAINLLSAHDLVTTFGLVGLFVIVFAETGLLVGFFLPGDSLLFLAGAYCATKPHGPQPHLPLGWTLLIVGVAAVLGAQVGYLIGRRAGPVLFDRPKSRLFKPRNVERTHEFLARYGEPKAIVLARFVPIVRTFMNPACGVAKVKASVFTRWNVIGGLGWTLVWILVGYALGTGLEKYINYVTLVIILVSVIPIALEILRSRRRATARR
jgi:membrane-associated protein